MAKEKRKRDRKKCRGRDPPTKKTILKKKHQKPVKQIKNAIEEQKSEWIASLFCFILPGGPCARV